MPPLRVMAARPEPNVVGQHPIRGTYEIEVTDVTDEERCSKGGKLRAVCVTNLASAYELGLDRVLRRLIYPGPDNALRARFRLLSLDRSVTGVTTSAYKGTTTGVQAGSTMFTMRWQFKLMDTSGRILVGLARTTSSPVDAFDDNTVSVATALKSLNNLILDEIAQTVDEEFGKLVPPSSSAPSARSL
jgi:hypothetical protein